MDIASADYNKLNKNRKIIYEHYYECSRLIMQITNILIAKFTEEEKLLHPLLLDYSYDEETYKKYKSISKHIKKQIKSFEKNIVQQSSSSYNPKKVICISNQLRALITRMTNLLSNTNHSEINTFINNIFYNSKFICSKIREYTTRCRQDQRLFNYDDAAIEQSINKHFASMIDNVPTVSISSRSSRSSRYYDLYEEEEEEEYKPLRPAINSYKMYLPNHILRKLYDLANKIDQFNPSGDIDILSSVHLNSVIDAYNEITKLIQEYRIKQDRMTLLYIAEIQKELNLSILDCSLPNNQITEYHNSINKINQLLEVSPDTDYDSYTEIYVDAISEFEKFVEDIAKHNKSLNYMEHYSIGIIYLYTYGKLLNYSINRFRETKNSYITFLSSFGIKTQCWNNNTDDTTDYYDDSYDHYYDDNNYDYSFKKMKRKAPLDKDSQVFYSKIKTWRHKTPSGD